MRLRDPGFKVETETSKKSEPVTLSAEDFEVMVLIKLNKMS